MIALTLSWYSLRPLVKRANQYKWFCILTLLYLSQVDYSFATCDPGDESVQLLNPRFVEPRNVSRLELFPGDNATLSCAVSRQGKVFTDPILQWWCNFTDPRCHDYPQYDDSDPIVFIRYSSSTDEALHLNSTLELTSLVPSQSGRYYCVAYSEDQLTSKCPESVSVEVVISEKSPPVITGHTVSRVAFESKPFNLTCSATGYPIPSFQWEKDGSTLPGGQDGILRYSSGKVTDTGEYYCIARNGFGTVRSQVISVNVKAPEGLKTPVIVVIIAIAVILLAVLIGMCVFCARQRTISCSCMTKKIRHIDSDSNRVIHRANVVNVFSSPRGSKLSRADSSHERHTFLHMHDVFIHHHSSDGILAELLRSKLQDRESHLNVGLWSEVEQPDNRASSRNKLLRLRLLNCSRIIIIASCKYLLHDYHALTSALAKSRATPDSLRSKMIVVRLLEEGALPSELTKDIVSSLEYNVDTDSCYFWPKFMKVAIPAQKEILYWA